MNVFTDCWTCSAPLPADRMSVECEACEAERVARDAVADAPARYEAATRYSCPVRDQECRYTVDSEGRATGCVTHDGPRARKTAADGRNANGETSTHAKPGRTVLTVLQGGLR